MDRIDVHHHLVTENNPMYGMPDGMTWWSVDNALRLMDDNSIRMAMLSPMPRLPANARLIRLMTALRDGPTGRTKPVRELIRTGFRRANQLAADVASARPERFGFYAVLGLVNGDDAVKEAAYAFDVLGADGVLLTTNVGPVYVGDEAFEPLFAELNRRRAVVFIHPMPLPCPLVPGIPGHVADFLLSTVRAATNLVHKGTLLRYPELRIILPHGGGFIPYAVQRMVWALASHDPSRSMDELTAQYRSFYFDVAISTAPDTLAALLAFAEKTHLLYGSDFPYTQPESVRFYTRQLDATDMDPQVRDGLNHANAESLFPVCARPKRQQADHPSLRERA